jgi:hypothetical protein
MTRNYTPLPWPYIARADRDDAADEIAAALKTTVALTEVEDDPEHLRSIARTVNHLQNALRHLESAGAPTRPASCGFEL